MWKRITRKSRKDLGFLCWESSFKMLVWRSEVGGLGEDILRVYTDSLERSGINVTITDRNRTGFGRVI